MATRKLTPKQRKNNAMKELNEIFNDFLLQQVNDKKITLDDLTELKNLFAQPFNEYKPNRKNEVTNDNP